MTRKRMAREERRDLTTTHLLEAAQKLISKKGLAATSVEDIAAAAGYTRGAFYSNFKSKSDLFIELLRRDHQKTHEEFTRVFSDKVPIEEIHARTRDLYSRLYRDNECFMTWTEARMLGARDPKFRAKLGALMVEKRDQIAGFIEYFCQRVGATPPVPPAAMAMGFISLVEGVKLFMLSSPMNMTPETAESVLDVFMDAIMQLARVRAS